MRNKIRNTAILHPLDSRGVLRKTMKQGIRRREAGLSDGPEGAEDRAESLADTREGDSCKAIVQ